MKGDRHEFWDMGGMVWMVNLDDPFCTTTFETMAEVDAFIQELEKAKREVFDDEGNKKDTAQYPEVANPNDGRWLVGLSFFPGGRGPIPIILMANTEHKSIPIGHGLHENAADLSYRDAAKIVGWLQGALPDLQRIIKETT